jgi:hypothetical protein
MLKFIEKNKNNKLLIFHNVTKTGSTTLTNGILPAFYNRGIIDHKKYYRIHEYRENNKIVVYSGHRIYKFIFDNKDVIMFSLVRNPVDRIISRFYATQSMNCFGKDLTLEEIFINNHNRYFNKIPKKIYADRIALMDPDPYWHNNNYILIYSGRCFDGKSEELFNEISLDNCNKIITNIKNNQIQFIDKENKPFIVPTIFGITERMNESIKLLGKIYAWDNNKINKFISENIHHNKNKELDKDKISKELKDAILEKNQYSFMIYNAAVESFDNQLKYFGIK